MISPARDLALRLQSAGLGQIGGTSGWVISTSREPDGRFNTITTYDTGGEDLDTDEQDLTVHFIMVRVKARDYLEAYNKQREIQKLLIPGFTTTSARYISWKSTSGIAQVEVDDNNYSILTANYSVFCELKDA